jgi:hypothetical protein
MDLLNRIDGEPIEPGQCFQIPVIGIPGIPVIGIGSGGTGSIPATPAAALTAEGQQALLAAGIPIAGPQAQQTGPGGFTLAQAEIVLAEFALSPQAIVNALLQEFPALLQKPPAAPGSPRGSVPGVLPQQYRSQLGAIVKLTPPGRPLIFEGQPTGLYAATWYQPAQAELAATFPGLTLGQEVSTPPPPPPPPPHPLPPLTITHHLAPSPLPPQSTPVSVFGYHLILTGTKAQQAIELAAAEEVLRPSPQSPPPGPDDFWHQWEKIRAQLQVLRQINLLVKIANCIVTEPGSILTETLCIGLEIGQHTALGLLAKGLVFIYNRLTRPQQQEIQVRLKAADPPLPVNAMFGKPCEPCMYGVGEDAIEEELV